MVSQVASGASRARHVENLSGVIGQMLRPAEQRLKHRVWLAPNCDSAIEVVVGKLGQRAGDDVPGLLPGGHQVRARVVRLDDKLLIAIARRLVTIGDQEFTPPRAEIPSQVLDDERQRIHLIARTAEEVFVRYRRERPFNKEAMGA